MRNDYEYRLGHFKGAIPAGTVNFREVPQLLAKYREKSKGKKLGFVLQEFGREINTTGSKANDSQMQKVVVLMKDELEKMKEQVLNIL